jgi:hypothetical protein
MPNYTVRDTETNKIVTFAWNGEGSPTDADMREIFAQARNTQPAKPTELTAEEKFAGANPNLYGAYGAAKETGKEALKLGGMVLGGAAGSGAGPVGAVAGAGLGYAGTEALLDKLGGGEGKMSLGAFTEGAIGELGGRAVGSGVRSLMKSAKETAELVDLAKEYGHPFTSAELSTPSHGGIPSKALSPIESALAWFPGSAGTMQAHYMRELKSLMSVRDKLIDEVSQGKGSVKSLENAGIEIRNKLDALFRGAKMQNQGAVDELKDGLLREMGMHDTYETLGLKAKEVIAKRSAEAVEKKNALYQEVGSSVPDVDLETPSLMRAAESIAERRKALPVNDPTMMKVLGWAAKKQELTASQQATLAEVEKYAPEVRAQILKEVGIDPSAVGSGVKRNWQALQDMRAELNNLIAGEDQAIIKGNPALKGQLSPTGHIYAELKKALDKDFEEIARQTGTDALEKLKIANAFFKDEYAPIWKNKDIQRLAYSKPQVIVDTIFRKNSAPEIRLVEKVVGEETFNKLKGGFVTKMTESATKNGEFSFERLFNEFSKIDKATLNSIFTEEESRSIAKYITAGTKQESLPLMDKYLLKLMKTDRPETIVNLVFHPNNAKNIRMVQGVLGEDLFNQAKTYFTEQLFKMSEHDLYRAVPSVRAAAKFDDATLRAIYNTPQQYKLTKDLLELSKYSFGAERIAGNPSGTAPNIVTFYEGKALLKDPASGAITWLTPPALAKLYLKASGSLLNLGLKMKESSPAAAKIKTQILSVAGADAVKNWLNEE